MSLATHEVDVFQPPRTELEPDRDNLLELLRAPTPDQQRILTPEALAFVGELVERFTPQLKRLLGERERRQARYDDGELPGFDPATAFTRESEWSVAAIPEEVQDRRTEITGPVSRKMVVNALNSGARVYMADLEDSTAPTWINVVAGQLNLLDAIRREIDFTSPEGKRYELNDQTAVLMVRPRGLHLPERHLRFRGRPVPAALVDFGLYLFHNHAELARRGSRPYFYLPKLQHHAEATWWNDVISFAERRLGMKPATVRVTVLIETLPAVFQMHEILHALRDRALGLNCGRWDYIFSYIKTLRKHPDRVLPDRDAVSMSTPFLRAYSQLLIDTCHRRGGFAMGGMAAQVPIRDDEKANDEALARVQADKQREAADGHDGTWVAHPALERLARQAFDAVIHGDNQLGWRPEIGEISAAMLLAPCKGEVTEAGVRRNVDVAVRYLAAWLRGNGCVAIHHLMEDAATAEISRAQLWQWAHHGVTLTNGRQVDHDWLDECFDDARRLLCADANILDIQAINCATALLKGMTRSYELGDFLTLPAYAQLGD